MGGATLAHVLATLVPGGAVAASGNSAVPTCRRRCSRSSCAASRCSASTPPGTPIDRRREVWGRIATDLKPVGLDAMGQVVDLAHVEGALDEIGRGGVTGRYVVQL